eukprot:Gb_24207 [translate_table: standard]
MLICFSFCFSVTLVSVYDIDARRFGQVKELCKLKVERVRGREKSNLESALSWEGAQIHGKRGGGKRVGQNDYYYHFDNRGW